MCNGPNLTNSNHYIKEHSKATNTIQIIVTTKKHDDKQHNNDIYISQIIVTKKKTVHQRAQK